MPHLRLTTQQLTQLQEKFPRVSQIRAFEAITRQEVNNLKRAGWEKLDTGSNGEEYWGKR